jgi:GTPase SAR1 family protein
MTATKESAERALNRLIQLIDKPALVEELQRTAQGVHRLERTRDVIAQADKQLRTPPQISIALLGPSRNGKSTLLNALTSHSILPTSDIRPCTASIIRLKWSPTWTLQINYVSLEELRADLDKALGDARDYVNQLARKTLTDQPDDPRYLQQELSRFTTLLRIDDKLPPRSLVEAVQSAVIPGAIAGLLGKQQVVEVEHAERLVKTLKKYLSTEDVYWTIVSSCEIGGPFSDWHQALELVDVPGTNDTNVERARITNSLQQQCRAVAIVTSESNLGNDIQDWLRNSSVLARFLEARESDYQRIIVIRTKFDSYQPEISLDSDASEEDELDAFRQAVAAHKQRQTEAFHDMLKQIASPLLPVGETPDELTVYHDRIRRIESIPVFFVSAVAHEAFAGRMRATRQQRQRMVDHFGDDVTGTGIPALRSHFTDLSQAALEGSFYAEIYHDCTEELDRLVQYFRSQRVLATADTANSGAAVTQLIERTRSQVLPWLSQTVNKHTDQFTKAAQEQSNHLKRRMEEIARVSQRRLEDKIDKWSNLAWNTLRATARKGGEHRTSGGNHIDINNDICTVLVDELIVGWSAYRDEVIAQQISSATHTIATQLCERLSQLATLATTDASREAVEQVVQQLMMLTNEQRSLLLKRVDGLVNRLQSIRQPAMEIVFAEMSEVYIHVGFEHGPGCQQRMRQKLVGGFQQRLPSIRQQISSMVEDALAELLSGCGEAMRNYGVQAQQQISGSLEDVTRAFQQDHRMQAQARLQQLDQVIALLPSPA